MDAHFRSHFDTAKAKLEHVRSNLRLEKYGRYYVARSSFNVETQITSSQVLECDIGVTDCGLQISSTITICVKHVSYQVLRSTYIHQRSRMAMGCQWVIVYLNVCSRKFTETMQGHLWTCFMSGVF